MKKMILLFLAVLTAGCLSEQEKMEQARLKREAEDSAALKVALMPTLDCLPFFYAQEHGIYRSLNLPARLVTYNAQMDCDTALLRGHVELSYTDLVKAAALQGAGADLYVIAQTDGSEQLMANKNRPVKNVKQLKDRMVGLSRNGLGDFLTDRFSDSLQLTGMDVFKPQVNDVVLRADMLCNNMLDAAFLPEPHATRARLAGHREIYGSRQTRMNLTAIMATGQAATDTSRHAQIRLLLEGYDQAVAQMNALTGTDSLRTLLSTVCHLSEAVIDNLPPLRFRPLEAPTGHRTDTVVKWVKRRRLVPESYRGDTLIITSFFQKH
ncbi:MAG: ABC transporter substrate-binding protein [Clostridium sp.]|nr:ABC transporter substrate-binding protein [Clostridium sp.]